MQFSSYAEPGAELVIVFTTVPPLAERSVIVQVLWMNCYRILACLYILRKQYLFSLCVQFIPSIIKGIH